MQYAKVLTNKILVVCSSCTTYCKLQHSTNYNLAKNLSLNCFWLFFLIQFLFQLAAVGKEVLVAICTKTFYCWLKSKRHKKAEALKQPQTVKVLKQSNAQQQLEPTHANTQTLKHFHSHIESINGKCQMALYAQQKKINTFLCYNSWHSII